MSATATIVTTSTGGIAVAFDYSPYLERIASALERIVELSTSTGIRTVTPYEWSNGVDLYNWYIQQGYALTTGTNTTSTVAGFADAAKFISGQMPRFL